MPKEEDSGRVSHKQNDRLAKAESVTIEIQSTSVADAVLKGIWE
jgi:hypothetical protein